MIARQHDAGFEIGELGELSCVMMKNRVELCVVGQIEAFFGAADKLVYDPGSGTGQGILPYLPLGELARGQQRAPQQQPGQQSGSGR